MTLEDVLQKIMLELEDQRKDEEEEGDSAFNDAIAVSVAIVSKYLNY